MLGGDAQHLPVMSPVSSVSAVPAPAARLEAGIA